jgi:hypothetical protein
LVATNADLEVARSVPVRQAGLAAVKNGCMMRWYDDYLRWLYRGGRPNFFARLQNRASAIAFAAGIWPKRVAALEVRGRRSGRVISFPVVIADYENERYLVSMLGEEANWVRNVRAAGGHAVLRHGRREAVRLEEVPAEARPPTLRRYLERAPGPAPTSPSIAAPHPKSSNASRPGFPSSASGPNRQVAPDD